MAQKETQVRRMMWDSPEDGEQVVTVVADNGRTLDVRTPFGFLVEGVPKRRLRELGKADDRASFTIKQD